MKSTILDTNLLVLYLIGTIDLELIGKSKRLRTYDKSDFSLIKNIVENSENIITTNSILSECCNLLDKENGKDAKVFKQIRELIRVSIDGTQKSSLIVENDVFLKLRYTDAEVYELSKEGNTVYTDDFDLYGKICGNGGNAVNINHLRKI